MNSNKNRPRKKVILILIVVSFFIIICIAVATFFSLSKVFSPKIPPIKKTDLNQVTNSNKNIQTIKKPVIPKFDKTKYSNSVPSSLWVVVNKQHPLTSIQYTPSDLVINNGATISNAASVDFQAMMAAISLQSVSVNIVSSYRSYGSQTAIYNNYASIYGQAKTDTFSARPGYSEHQTGLSVDFGNPVETACNLEDCFGSTVAGQWLFAHAYEYGFIMRYPADKQAITGYKYEPWHFRYVGKELAAEMKKTSITTLEEFFGISGGEIYI